MTFSLGITGAPADNPAQPLLVDIDDSAGRFGNEQAAMQNNTPILCRELDGNLAYYMFDSERSIPGVTRILKRVGP